MLLSHIKETVFDFLLSQVLSGSDDNLLRTTTWILSHLSITSVQLGSKVFSTLTEYLKNVEEDKSKPDFTVFSILRLIEAKSKFYSAETTQIMEKYIESYPNETGRIYAAQCLRRAATEGNINFDHHTLNALKNSVKSQRTNGPRRHFRM